MINASFLDKITQIILEEKVDTTKKTVVVLPNKRAKLFLIEALQKQISKTIIAPKIISIEEFIQEIVSIRSIDSIELLFEFYDVYLSVTKKSEQQSFEIFANWAKTLLQDFNEIDRHLIDSQHVLSYIKDIEDIKKWGVEAKNKTKLIENYIDFWKLLPLYYSSLYKHLKQKKIGYQGLIYREAVGNISGFIESSKKEKYIFAGFNALNVAEEKIIQKLISADIAKIYWDIDLVFLNDPHHDAALFIRRFKDNWSYYKSNKFQWIADDFRQTKNIHIIGTPKSVGQAKIAGDIINKLSHTNTSLDDIAVVLSEESLLIPLLYSLPASVSSLNITMSYSAKNNPVQILLDKLFKMHTAALVRNPSDYVFYYKDVLGVLAHPLVKSYAHTENIIDIIQKNNYTFFTHKKLMSLTSNSSKLFSLLFQKWEIDSLAVLDVFSEILLKIKNNLSPDNEEDNITKTFVFAVFQVINKLINYYSKHPNVNKVETLYAVYKQVIDLAEVSFEGEPLKGLQIMGVLESRVLDFDNVIITSLNEGKFPAGKSQNSFIPYDVKKELGLPTFKEKDAIYAYHFYHLLQRAKNIYLIYNIGNEGIDAGEKSRFITQLEIEKQENHTLSHKILNAALPNIAYSPIVVPKSESIMLRLKEISESGFSPSSLANYIRNPIQFYFQKILRIREIEEVEENIAINTLGTIIHKTLENLYRPFLGEFLTELNIENCLLKMESEILSQFKYIYKEGEIRKGKNLLAFEVAKRNISDFLKMELDNLKNGDVVKILALEQSCQRILTHQNLPYPVLIKGNIDRIEERNNVLRIIDYKTGSVNKSDVILSSWKNLTKEIKNNKIIQLLAYAFIYQDNINKKPLEVGIISFKKLKSGFLAFTFKNGKENISQIDVTFLDFYTQELALLIGEILNSEIEFRENI